MDKSKKALTYCVLVILTVILIAVIVLLVRAIKNQKAEQTTLTEIVQNLNQRKNRLENELAKVANGQTQNTTRNNSAVSLIERLAREQLKGHNIYVGDNSNKEYSAKNVEITKVEVFNEKYMDLKHKQAAKQTEENGEQEESSYVYDKIKDGTWDYAGYITFILEYDEDVTDGWWAGYGPVATEGHYALGQYIFTVKDGKMEFSTGW